MSIKLSKTFFILFFLLILPVSAFVFSADAHAQATENITYKFIERLPFIGPSLTSAGSGTLIVQYLGRVYTLILSVSALLAFFMLIVGGVQYTYIALSPSAKGEAKSRIQNALLGLLIVFGAYLILNTINPDLVRGDLVIQPISESGGAGGNVTTTPLNPGAVAGTPGINTGGPRGTCEGCVDVNSLNIPAKGVGAGCGGSSPCQINGVVGTKLQTLDASLDSAGIQWQVTETYPPTTSAHRAGCHYNGTCVDAALRGNYSNQDVVTAYNSARAAGLRPVYEVKSQARVRELIDAGVPPGGVIVVGHATGEHFSLYNN
jgi:hypothetical protein